MSLQDPRSDENLKLSVEQGIPVCCDEEMMRKGQSKDEDFEVLRGTETSYLAPNSEIEDKLCGFQKHVLSPPYVQTVEEFDNKEKSEALPELEMPEETNLFCTLREYLKHNICLPVVESVQGTNMKQFQGSLHTQLPSIEKHWLSLLSNIDPAYLDEECDAEVPVIPNESGFGRTLRYNDNVEDEDTFTTGARTSNFENSCSVLGKDIPDSRFPQIKVVEGVSMDSPSYGEEQDICCRKYKSKMHDPNAKSCHEQRNSLVEVLEDIGNKCIKYIDPASFDEKGVTAVTVLPEEYEIGCTDEDNDRIEDILTTGARIFNYESTSLLTEEANPVTGFQKIKIVEEVVADSLPDGEKQNECGKELKSKLHMSGKSCEGNSLAEIGEDNEKSFRVVSPNSSMLQEADLEITNKQESQTSQSNKVEILESHVEATEKGKSTHKSDEIVQDTRNKCMGSISPTTLQVEPVNYSVPQESVLSITNKIENQTAQSLIAVTGCSEMEILKSSVEEVAKKSSSFGNVWSRRGKSASAPQVRTRKSKFMSKCNVDTKVEMDIKTKSVAKDLFFVLDEEIFSPNKENSGSGVYMRKKGKLEEIKHSKSQSSQALKANFSPNIYSAERVSSISKKDNLTPKVDQQWSSPRKPLESHINLAHEHDNMELKKNTVERVPFQSLTNSQDYSKLRTRGPLSAAKSIKDASNCGLISEKCTKPSVRQNI